MNELGSDCPSVEDEKLDKYSGSCEERWETAGESILLPVELRKELG